MLRLLRHDASKTPHARIDIAIVLQPCFTARKVKDTEQALIAARIASPPTSAPGLLLRKGAQIREKYAGVVLLVEFRCLQAGHEEKCATGAGGKRGWLGDDVVDSIGEPKVPDPTPSDRGG